MIFLFLQLLSSQTGLIDKCSWDDNILMGPLPAFHNVLLAGGFGNDGMYWSLLHYILFYQFVRNGINILTYHLLNTSI